MDSKKDFSVETNSLSIKLSQTLDEVGLNDKIVAMRRRKGMLKEYLETTVLRLLDKDAHLYTFGSQIEGTTTRGLQSDTDCVLCDHRANVIQYWNEFKPKVKNYIMLQDKCVPPGYCLLQYTDYTHTKDGDARPCIDDDGDSVIRDVNEEIILRNTQFFNQKGRYVKNGPAETEEGRTGFQDADRVYALPCKSWPIQARDWLSLKRNGGWPTNEMKTTCSRTVCFVVPVGNNASDTQQYEWRVSTSVAERYLMFNINITQLRCYTVMKMIIKTFISPKYPKTISSFMCKTVLFHCIANSQMNSWMESNLINCLNYCLSTLYHFVLNSDCPHFIIPKNNLLKGHMTLEKKHYILETLAKILNSKGKALFDINCDNIGPLLTLKFYDIIDRCPNASVDLAGQLMSNSGLEIDGIKYVLLSELNDKLDIQSAIQKLSQFMLKLVKLYSSYDSYGKIACCFAAQILGRTMGSVIACSQIKHNKTLTLEALTWFSCGLQYDISSSKLKLASFLYCMGDIECLERVLKDVEESYDLSVVEPLCRCYHFARKGSKSNFNKSCFETSNGYADFKHLTAACVIFLPCEIDCCPHELKYEMFRCQLETKACRGEEDKWMDWAVLDSLSYLYFLQYKTYDRLGRSEEKKMALDKLSEMIDNEPNLGHKETALNLLGQCMEHENQSATALECYMSSLQVRRSNNAANIHICRLLNKIVMNHIQMK